jgi:hypothetical protein
MKILIGNTGLVGQSILEKIQFDLEYNSKNLHTFDSTTNEESELWLSCLPATKWKVNQDVIGDIENIMSIYDKIKGGKYKKIVLISTIDVYVDSPLQSNEDFYPVFKSLNYGSNRYFFELLVKEIDCDNIQIYRLPALFCSKIKKNIIYDLLNDNNIDKINPNTEFQWYNLDRLVDDIKEIDKNGTYNLFTEPIHTEEILKIFDISIDQFETPSNSITYNYSTKYTASGYTQTKEEVYKELINFIYEFKHKSTSI